MTIYCSECGKPNQDDAETCKACKKPLSQRKAGARKFKGTMIMGNISSPPQASTPTQSVSEVPPSAASSRPPSSRARQRRPAKQTLLGQPALMSSPSSRPSDPSELPEGVFRDSTRPAAPDQPSTSEQPYSAALFGAAEANGGSSSATQDAQGESVVTEAQDAPYVNAKSRGVGCLGWSFALLSFIPGLGFFFGALAIIWGLILRREGGMKLVFLGTVGFALSCAVVAYTIRSMDGAKKMLDSLPKLDSIGEVFQQYPMKNAIDHIEAYYLEQNEYPESLETLFAWAKASGNLTIESDFVDLSNWKNLRGNNPLLYYERSSDGTGYFLRGVGEDATPFTEDDVVPKVRDDERDKIGLILERPATL